MSEEWQPVRVPRFEPFAAYRYPSSEDLATVTAPPYDVLSEADVRAQRANNPHNITLVDVPLASDAPDPYEHAASILASWLEAGVLVVDERPSFTLYRMEFRDSAGHDRRTVGVLGALEVVDEGGDGVLPHERTTPKAKTDRLDLTRATSCNLSPVWGLSLSAGLTELLTQPGELLSEMIDDAGVRHRVERVDEPSRVDRIANAVSANAVLIADGHHRYAIARTYRDEQRASTGSRQTSAELVLTYVGELIDDQLSIDAIHRMYHGIGAAELTARLRGSFTADDAGNIDLSTVVSEMDRRGALCLLRSDGTGAWLTPTQGLIDNERALDGAYLERALSGTDVDVTYQHDVHLVADQLARGEAQVAVLIRPTGIEEIRRTAEERLLMPPKSTFFTPKLRTGMAIRPL